MQRACGIVPTLFVILAPLLVGCGRRAVIESNRVPISGRVTLDGKPLPGGSITLISTDNAAFSVTAVIRSDGGFSVADAPRGSVHAAIETESVVVGNPDNYVAIPQKYAHPETSALTATIEGDAPQPLAFDLHSQD
jgi:hypothetical protein